MCTSIHTHLHPTHLPPTHVRTDLCTYADTHARTHAHIFLRVRTFCRLTSVYTAASSSSCGSATAAPSRISRRQLDGRTQRTSSRRHAAWNARRRPGRPCASRPKPAPRSPPNTASRSVSTAAWPPADTSASWSKKLKPSSTCGHRDTRVHDLRMRSARRSWWAPAAQLSVVPAGSEATPTTATPLVVKPE
eukprot:245823-Chlamydomonas_euryale.AAC.3